MLSLSPHHHSGRLRPHEHTSYLPLGILLLTVGIILALSTAAATSLAVSSPGPQVGSVGLTGTVPGKPPVTAATIDTPSSGTRFTTSPITVSGTCPKTTLVEVFKNNIFAGSTMCDDKGRYSLKIDLMIGDNVLFARVYDALNQPGPDSNKVRVSYDAVPPQADPLASFAFSGDQLLLNTSAVFRGIFPKQNMTMPVDIIGGTPPYALNIDWGDTTNKVISRASNSTFKVTHAYDRPGTYQVTLQVSDTNKRVAFLTVASIVNGQPEAVAATSGSSSQAHSLVARLLVLWPFYTAAAAAVVSFWLGEQREKRVLARHALITSH